MLEDSEFGGHAGLIQPPPHSTLSSAREQLMLVYGTDPWDDAQGTDAVLALVLAGKYPSVPTQAPAEILPLQPEVLMVALSNVGTTVQFVGVGSMDLRRARIKISPDASMIPHTFGPEKEYSLSPMHVVQLEVGSIAPGHYWVQVLMNNIQVTDVWEVDVV